MGGGASGGWHVGHFVFWGCGARKTGDKQGLLKGKLKISVCVCVFLSASTWEESCVLLANMKKHLADCVQDVCSLFSIFCQLYHCRCCVGFCQVRMNKQG